MACRIISSNKPGKRRRTGPCAGFTLMEFLVSMGLAGIIIAVIGALCLYSGLNFAIIANYTEMDCASINAMDRITRDIRSANSASNITSSGMTFATDSGVPLTYSYSSGTRKLTRTQGTNRLDVLTDCDNLQFLIYQRTPIAGTFSQYAIGATNETKAVLVTWTCSRTILGRKLTTDSASAGRVVMRAN